MPLIMTQNLSPRTEPRSQAKDFPSSPPSLSFAARLHLPRVHYGLVPDFRGSQRSRLAPKYARPAR